MLLIFTFLGREYIEIGEKNTTTSHFVWVVTCSLILPFTTERWVKKPEVVRAKPSSVVRQPEPRAVWFCTLTTSRAGFEHRVTCVCHGVKDTIATRFPNPVDSSVFSQCLWLGVILNPPGASEQKWASLRGSISKEALPESCRASKRSSLSLLQVLGSKWAQSYL